jgi:hypothetical protein
MFIVCPRDGKMTPANPDQAVPFADFLYQIGAKKDHIVFCEEHKKKKIDYYCIQHKDFLCSHCRFDHFEHK